MKKALSLFLAVVMVVGMIPLSAISIFAETTEVTLSDDAASATYTDLNEAINAVDDGGTVKIVGTYTLPSGFTWTDHNKTVTITGGTFDASAYGANIDIYDGVVFDNLTVKFPAGKSVFANCNPLTIKENVTVENKLNSINGGGLHCELTGDTYLAIYSGNYERIAGSGCRNTINGDTHVIVGGNTNAALGDTPTDAWTSVVHGGGWGGTSGNYVGDHVIGNTYVTIEGNAKANRVFGGNSDATSSVTGNSYVTVTGGAVYTLYGGGRGAAANDTFVTVSGGSITNLYGGSENNSAKNTQVTVSGGSITNLYGGSDKNKDTTAQVTATNTQVTVTGGDVKSIYGGCNSGTVTGDTNVYVGGEANSSCDALSHSYTYCIYGGGTTDTVEGNTYVTLDGNAKANYVFGGGSVSTASIVGTTHVNVKGGTYMSVYGGGRGTSVANTVVNVTGGTVEQLFGGCENAAVTGDTMVRVLGGNISRRIYGGSYNNYASLSWQSSHGVAGTSAVVLGSGANITLDYDDSDCSIYAGSRQADDVDGTTILAYLNADAYNAHGSKQGAQDGTMKLIMGSKAVADEIHTLKHTVNGNVITESCTDSGCDHNATVSLVVADGANLNYSGEAITPAVIEYSGNWLAEELGTEITYANNDKPGMATATATHERLGNVTLEFEITEIFVGVYNEDKDGDDKVSFESLIGTTLAQNTIYRLMEDIDLGGTTIKADKITLASGTVFDGNGHSVTGFSLASDSSVTDTNISLFKADGSATIKNVTFGSEASKIEVSMVNANTSYAVVMADIPGGKTLTFDNITVYTTMTGDTETTATDRRGGAIIGRVYGTVKLTDCKTYGSITDTQGRTGFGGFIGLIPTDVRVTITDCTNNVSISTERMAGGFIGQSWTAYLTMSGCVNNGNITITEALAGGFMGQFYSATATANANSITDCTNNGTVSGPAAIGGFVGEWNSKAKANKGTLTLTGFNQSGAVQATGGDAGGIIGKFLAFDDLTVNDLKSDDTGSVEATGKAGGIFGYSEQVPSAGVTVTVNGGSSANSVKSTGSHAGGVVGYAAVAVSYNINNYTNKGTVTTTAARQNAGGLFGQVKTIKPLTVNGFINEGNIVSKNNGAAMIGQYDNPTSTASFTGCKNIATVTAQNGSAGMIVGWGSGTVAVTVENCENSGAMNGAGRAGGFFGGMTSNSLSVTDCKNMATITGNANNTGGFAGDYTVNGAASVYGFENYGTVNTGTNHAGGFVGILTVKANASLEKIVNNGAIGTKNGYAAAILGQLATNGYSVTIEDVLNTGSVTSNKKAAVVVGWMGAGSISVNRGINLGTINSTWGTTGTFGFSEATTESITVTNCINLGATKKGANFYPIWHEGISETAEYNNDFGSTNMYLASLVSNDMPTNGATALTDLDEALAILNTATYTSAWGPFKASDVDENGKATGIVLATPVLYGVQMGTTYTRDDKEGTYTSARFVGTIGNTLAYRYIGLNISLKGGKTKTITVPNVYTSILAGSGDEQKTVTAESLGGTYIFAITMEDIPTTGTYEFTVTSYAVGTDGTEYSSDSGFIFVFENGTLKSKTPVTVVA